MSLLAATSAAIIVAAILAGAAVGTFFAYLYIVRKASINAAREEALALAETRGEIIADLEARLESLERRHRDSEEACVGRIRELEKVLGKTRAEAREQAYQMQRFYAAELADLLVGVQEDLETVPPKCRACADSHPRAFCPRAPSCVTESWNDDVLPRLSAPEPLQTVHGIVESHGVRHDAGHVQPAGGHEVDDASEGAGTRMTDRSAQRAARDDEALEIDRCVLSAAAEQHDVGVRREPFGHVRDHSGRAARLDAPNGYSIPDAIQTDAASNQGNSGGPLVNMSGEVVGVNAQIESDSGGNDGIGFAIPSNTVRSVVSQILSTGKVEHAYLGVSLAERDGMAGAEVAEVRSGSPAEEAGLQAGDVISAVDGQAVASAEELQRLIEAKKPGDELELTVDREGATVTVTVTLGSRPA